MLFIAENTEIEDDVILEFKKNAGEGLEGRPEPSLLVLLRAAAALLLLPTAGLKG